ncbi:hypothetical protein C3L33_11597, partial [Rhododendron williamsianum]
MKMSCFSCCMSEETVNRKSLKKSIQEYKDAKKLASFANISFKSDSSKRRYIAEEIAKIGKGNITAQIFSFSDLSVATQNFNPDSLVGEGMSPDKKPLDWNTRMKIAEGAARGLEYLHEAANPPAQPLFKDKRKFSLMADPSLEGNYPVKGLYQALAIAAMCLQEEASVRPLISDVVTALAFLSNKEEGDDEEKEKSPSGRNTVDDVEKDAPDGAWERD